MIFKLTLFLMLFVFVTGISFAQEQKKEEQKLNAPDPNKTTTKESKYNKMLEEPNELGGSEVLEKENKEEMEVEESPLQGEPIIGAEVFEEQPTIDPNDKGKKKEKEKKDKKQSGKLPD